MNKERLSYLRLQYLSGNITARELSELKSLVNDPNLDAEFSDLAEEVWMAPDSDVQPMTAEEANKIYLQVTSVVQQKRPVRLWRRLTVAASVILIAGSGLYFLLNKQNSGFKATSVYAADAAPGKVGATLTLANGKQIALSNASKGELAKEAGVMITKQADGKLVYEVAAGANDHKVNTLATARGETYQVRLSDGTMVWLNADSKLTYAASLNGNKGQQERRVKLEGEAYFEVTKNKNSPFIVETGGQEVQVLGTHFNINSYADEPVATTTLLEGSVRVAAGKAGQSVIISPGQQAINRQGSLKVAQANLEQVMDWKQGDFYLNHVNFKTAMRKIARWYNVEVVYDASVSDITEAGGWISRNKKLSEILQSIEATEQVHFKVEGRKVIVFK
ncbi:FecR family protein [Pedobacter africanus]|uniref:Ferric-dicitrate binding protein FerR (Iron transport regulator) n=1 Tax=Pedobacter africanus TaxID=151894 RepID=A0ACC6KU09_9SPHI|nr:FecR domain-containing protein [Pedobacter africanus]MDR6782845.1 ferric-dicitrate binding protein FerR (iron transport regulator) [Pedobacter africanus]